MPKPRPPADNLPEALASAFPEADRIVAAAAGAEVFLVGGAVRDLLLEGTVSDIDLVTDGDPAAIAGRLGEAVTFHDRFGTARVSAGGREVDIVRARTETYERPGALPSVAPATRIEDDLARRDFTLNAMAIPLGSEPRLIDPHGGRADLVAGSLRVLHDRSFLDDPTRALRAARYAARFDFELEPETARLLGDTDLGAVSEERRRAELLRVAAEPRAARAFELLREWGIVDLGPGAVELIGRVAEITRQPPWQGFVDRDSAVLAAATAAQADLGDLTESPPGSPSEGTRLARGRDPVELALARARGAAWLDEYVDHWRHVSLEIGGEELIAAGVPEGPAVGRGLEAALRSKLDGATSGPQDELSVALEAARKP